MNRTHLQQRFSCLTPLFIFAAAIAVRYLLQSRISITDCDAEAYIQGARSIRTGAGYVDAAGNHLNHWPPGYSFLLSFWADPLAGAFAINLISHGLASALTWILARREGWEAGHCLALAGIVAFGFFSDLTCYAKPDTLTYAGFLAGVLSYRRDTFWGRAGGSIVFALLIPVKMMAVTFAPGLLLAELVCLRPKAFFAARWKESLLAGGLWGLSLGAVLWYNAVALKEATPTTYVPASFHSIFVETGRFCVDFFRCGLALWYGSLRPLPYLAAFLAVAALGISCIATLRWLQGGRLVFKMGLAVLMLSFGLECYRVFFAGPRLMGYGMLLMLIGLRPVSRSVLLWATYAAAILMLSVYNHLSCGNLGLNHPDYQKAALETLPHLPPGEIIHTNARALLDVHTGRQSILTDDLESLPPGSIFWEVNLPNHDAIMVNVTRPAPRDGTWHETARLTTSRVYQKIRP